MIYVFDNLSSLEDSRCLAGIINLFIKRHFFKPFSSITVITWENSEFILFFLAEYSFEKFFFALSVVFHSSMIVKMILCQIGHNRHLDWYTVKLVLMNRMRRKLHNNEVNLLLFCSSENCCIRAVEATVAFRSLRFALPATSIVAVLNIAVLYPTSYSISFR